MTGIIQSFKCHAARHRAIADHRDHMSVIAFQFLGAQ